MQIGILQTGETRTALLPTHGYYPAMFTRMFAPVAPQLSLRAYPVMDGVFPASAEECDAWLVTGSKFGVYDPEPWIAGLAAFLREARSAGRPILGICFGHQMLAEAFGGRVVKSEKGWGVGRHSYDVHDRPRWMADAGESLAFYANHQDQVVALPEDARTLASSAFCPHAMVAYGDTEAPYALSLQAHPEYTQAMAADLVSHLAADGIVPDDRAKAALESYGPPVDAEAFTRWSAEVLEQGVARARAA
ncbi:MAG: gamma-glutamyl-gamma-aminobutyrate hydrolase family protein [Pseudomonadota bacterium]